MTTLSDEEELAEQFFHSDDEELAKGNKFEEELSQALKMYQGKGEEIDQLDKKILFGLFCRDPQLLIDKHGKRENIKKANITPKI